MKAIIIREPGPATNFVVADIEKPSLQPGYILVEVRATSVNPIDTKVRAKQLPFSPEYPAILHVDFAGIVSEVASDVNDFTPGDFVFGLAGGIKGTISGALAEYVLVDARLAAPMPTNLSFAEAAALPLVSITAWEALVDKMHVSKGSTLLIHGGLGGVGHVAAQLGKSLGALVHTTVSSEHDMSETKKFGAEYAINYKTTEVADYVKAYTKGKGFDFIFDTVGGPNLEKSFQAARLNGSIACIAVRGSYDLTLLYSKGLSLHSVLMLIPLLTGDGRSHYGNILRKIKTLVEDGKIKPLLDKHVFNWNDVAKAHELVENKQQQGKVAILIED